MHAYIPFVVSYKLDPVWTVSSCTRQKSLCSSPSPERILRWYEANQSSVIILTDMVTSIIGLVEMLFAAALSTTQPGWCDISKEHERCCCTSQVCRSDLDRRQFAHERFLHAASYLEPSADGCNEHEFWPLHNRYYRTQRTCRRYRDRRALRLHNMY